MMVQQLLEFSGGFVTQLQFCGIIAAASSANGAWKIKKRGRMSTD